MARKLFIIGLSVAVVIAIMIGCSDKSSNPQVTQEFKLDFSQSDCLPDTRNEQVDGQSRVAPRQLTIRSGASECLSGTEGPMYDGGPQFDGTVRFAVSYDTLFVYHDSAYHNCCPMFWFAVEVDGSNVDFIEADTTTMPCDCMCYFNLDCSVSGMEPGTYTARLWTENKEHLLGEAVITITGVNGVYFRTSCDTVFVNHDARSANCGSVFVFDFRQSGQLLVFTEIDTSTQMQWCICEFNLAAHASGLEAGDYLVQLRDGGSVMESGPVDTLIAEGEIRIEPCLPVSPEVSRR